MAEQPADTIRRAAQAFRDAIKDVEPEGRRVVLASAAQVRSLADAFDAVAKEADYWHAHEKDGRVLQTLVGPRDDWTAILAAARACLGEPTSG